MSRHPFEAASFTFGTIFLVMALVGFADAAGLVTEGLIAAIVGTIVMMAVIGIALTVKRLSSDAVPISSTGDQYWNEGSEAVDPAPTTPPVNPAPTTPPEGDDPAALRL